MGIKVDLDEQLEREFRELAMKKFGYSKGAIKKATETAIRLWIETVSGTGSKSEKEATSGSRSATDLLTCLLKNTKHKTSVEEQHETRKSWVKVATERGRRK